MTMRSRILPQAEWHRLAGTEADSVWAQLPENATVLVVEREDAVIGCWVMIPCLHAECLWIAPAHRAKASVGARLWALFRRVVPALGVSCVFTASMSPDVAALLEHAGAERLPGSHYVLPVPKGVS